MEFYIKKNSTLPILKMEIIKDGRSDFNLNSFLSGDTTFLISLYDKLNDKFLFASKECFITSQTDYDGNISYFLNYQFTNKDTIKEGKYEVQVSIPSDQGVILLPLQGKYYVNILDSFSVNNLGYDTLYSANLPCCGFNQIFEIGGLTLSAYYYSGSLVIDYILTGTEIFDYDVTIDFTNVIYVLSGDPLSITTGVTINTGESRGMTQVVYPDFNYDNITQNTEIKSITINGVKSNTVLNLSEKTFFNTPPPTTTPTPNQTQTKTPSQTATQTKTPTKTNTPTPTQTSTNTLTPTNTITSTPTSTETSTPTVTPTNTETPSQTPTQTLTQTVSPNYGDYYLIGEFGPAADNGTISFPNLNIGDVNFNPNLIGQSGYGIYINKNKYVGTDNSVMLNKLIDANGTITLTQGTNSVTYTFTQNAFKTYNFGLFINYAWDNVSGIPPSPLGSIVVTSSASTDFNTIEPISIVVISVPITPTTTPNVTPTPTTTPNVTPTNTETPANTPTPTAPFYYYYNLLDCDNSNNKVGRSVIGGLTGTYNVDVNKCYLIVGIDLGPSYNYDLDSSLLVTNCNDLLCGAVTSTPTPTESETPTPTPTPTTTETPTNTPTPTESETPTPTPTESETPTPTPTNTPTNTPPASCPYIVGNFGTDSSLPAIRLDYDYSFTGLLYVVTSAGTQSFDSTYTYIKTLPNSLDSSTTFASLTFASDGVSNFLYVGGSSINKTIDIRDLTNNTSTTIGSCQISEMSLDRTGLEIGLLNQGYYQQLSVSPLSITSDIDVSGATNGDISLSRLDDLFWIVSNGPDIVKFDPVTKLVDSTLNIGFIGLTKQILDDPNNGYTYVLVNTESVYVFDNPISATTEIKIGSSGSTTTSMVIDPVNNKLYVLKVVGNNFSLIKIDITTLTLETEISLITISGKTNGYLIYEPNNAEILLSSIPFGDKIYRICTS